VQSSVQTSPDASHPTLIGRYALFDEIASGGMATVHYGLRVGAGGFSRVIAIKRLHSSLAGSAECAAMLMDEARLAARIRHPNVVPVIDVVLDRKELLLVMEYVHGESLSGLIRAACKRGESVPVGIAIRVLTDVLEGLHAAHETSNEAGEPLLIVHRDVSPQNVIVGADGSARVLDFGIAKALWRLQVTHGDQLKGKLGYMAPEQFDGRTIDRRVDIWAAAVVLWETLTRKRLFQADAQGEVRRRILLGQVPVPSTFASDLPRGLDDVVMRGLRIDPAERFATASEMAVALEGVTARAAPRDVGAWLQKVAGESLRERSERLQQIELAQKQSPAPLPAQPSILDAAERQDQTPGDAFVEGSPQQRAPRDRTRVAAWGIAVLALGVILAFVLLRTGARTLGGPAAGVSALAPAEPMAATGPSGAASYPPPAADNTLANTAPLPLVAAGAASGPVAASKRPPRTVRARPAPNCDPPYTVDKLGVRVPKSACY
jgi:eukaryotic-like serine/threonine-protein kinase